MELQKQETGNNNIPQSLRHLSQKPIVTFLQEGRMDKVANLLPSTIEQAIKGTPVAMLMKVVDRKNIEAFLAIELTKLASMINVDERLNLQGHQIPFICAQLVDTYKNESLADFKICFDRGVMGRYDDKLLRLDGAVINQWMAKYLEEKYQVIEAVLMSEKENPYQATVSKKPEEQRNSDKNLLSLLETVGGQRQSPVDLSKYLTPEQLKEIEDARKALTVGDRHSESNDYFRIKMQHAKKRREFQELLNRTSSEFYQKKGGYSDIKTYEDASGHYVYAENENEAEQIFKDAEKMNSTKKD